jgi:asparagine synthase (glutamine-hydrolysing)
MLDGQGADELFAGYRSYLAAHLASLLRQGRLVAAGRLVRGGGRMPDTSVTAAVALRALAYAVPERARPALRRALGRRALPAALDLEWFGARGVYSGGSMKRGGGLDEALRIAFSNTSLPSLLRYEDRNSMAFSIESRVPFLTPDLVNFAFSLPEDFLVARDGLSKAVFRAAMRGTVPDPILDRRDKIGFSTPEEQWLGLLRPWVDETLVAGRGRVPALRAAEVQRHWAAVIAGQRAFDWRVWRWLNAIRWAELFDVEFA